MDYHQDRFEDFSLLVYKNEKLIAVLPANIENGIVYSHKGLSYGGLVLDSALKFVDVLQAFKILLIFLNEQGIRELELKLMPKIYHAIPSDEINYLLFLTKAIQTRCDIASTIYLREALKIQSNRLEGVKKAEKIGLTVKEEQVYESFWERILVPNLASRHKAKPVHSVSEIELLGNKFPNNIRQFNVYNGNEIVAGATIFETENVAHVQYISANGDRQKLGSLDILFEHLINKTFSQKKYFDFGVSNENLGMNVNEGLLFWKESFGARSTAHSYYKVATENHVELNDIML